MDWLAGLLERTGRWVRAAGVGGSIFVAVAIVGSQALGWAKTGRWSPMPLGKALRGLGVDLPWPYAATDWIGLAKAARVALQVEASVFVGIGGSLLAWALGAAVIAAAIQGKRRLRPPTNPRARQR
jgi:hypothetical protein